MKIKTYSWILAGAYPLCGVILFLTLLKFSAIFSGFNIELPMLTKVTLAVHPIGWLSLFVAAGLIVILKDLRFRSPSLNPLFTFGLVVWVIGMIFALLDPFSRILVAIH